MARKKIDMVAEVIRGAEILSYFETAPLDIAIGLEIKVQDVVDERKKKAGTATRKPRKAEAPKNQEA